MQVATDLIRSPKDWALPEDILEASVPIRHRPKVRYRLVLRSAEDVEKARHAKLPVFAVTDSIVTMLGYPMKFPPLVLVPRSIRNAVESHLPVIEMLSEDAVREPRLEDVIVAMLRFDPLAARALADRNSDVLDRDYLLKRILTEDAEAEASRVRFQDNLLPSLPVKADPLPKAALDRIISSNVVRGVL